MYKRQVTGTSEFNGTVDVDANFAVRSGTTDKMTVASSTGNIYTAGGLAVDGNTDLGSDANDTLTILARVDSDLDPSGNGTKDFGQSDRQWKDGYFGGTVNATTFAGALTGNVTGNVTAASGSSSFNDLTVNGTLTGSISGNAGSATQLETARNIGGVSFNGTADINLPGVNSGGNQDTSGTAAKATDINIDETSTNGNFQVTFSNAGGVTSQSGNHYRQYIDNDNAHFLYNPSTYTLSGLNSVQSGIFGTSSQNAYGARTVSTSGPSGGSDGDIWYKY